MQAAMLWMCVAFGSLVFAAMLYSVASYRGPRGPGPRRYRYRSLLELLWAAVPIAIVVLAVLPTLRQHMAPAAPLVATVQE